MSEEDKATLRDLLEDLRDGNIPVEFVEAHVEGLVEDAGTALQE